jgi:anthranilate phosphoribosyltransferase
MTHDLLDALVNRRRRVEPEMCRSFWDRLHDRHVDRAEAAAVLAALSTAMPDPATVTTVVASLHERRPAHDHVFAGAVNIVGTGGGPRTANISTAAAFVAAAMGVRVVKTGSRASSGGVGSIDLLGRLGVGLTRSYAETADQLDRFGIAFAGYFVYPTELTRLARTVLPLDLRTIGRWINTIGPFLADLPVSAQLTGVSDVTHLPALSALAAARPERRTWLCSNELGADELLSFTTNSLHGPRGVDDGLLHAPQVDEGALHRPGSAAFQVGPVGHGDLSGLAASTDDVVMHFLDLLAGHAPAAAVDTVCLNAAALAVAAGQESGFTAGFHAARAAVEDGAPVALAERMRRVMAHG